MLLQYRAAAIAGLWTQIFFGLVLIMIYEAFYGSSSSTPPISFTQLASYVWLGQALYAMLPTYSDGEIRDMIRTGAIAYELCRPVDLYSTWYARAVAARTAPTVLRVAPLVAFAMLVLPAIGLDQWRLAPPGLGAGLGFAVALPCALLLGCAISTLINISLMWTLKGEGIAQIMTTAVYLFSGMIVPLPLFPDWARIAIEWLPFAGLVDLPFRVFTGNLALGSLPLVLGRQLGWTIVLIALGRRLLARGMRRVVIQGG